MHKSEQRGLMNKQRVRAYQSRLKISMSLFTVTVDYLLCKGGSPDGVGVFVVLSPVAKLLCGMTVPGQGASGGYNALSFTDGVLPSQMLLNKMVYLVSVD
jgi:hypothetical protein